MKKQYQRWLTYAGIAIAVTIVSAMVSFYVFSKIIKVEVPALAERSQVESKRLLDSLGLELVVTDKVYDLFVPEGHVIEQDIPAGTYVENNTEVGVVVSLGPEVRLIPSFLGMSLEGAERMLTEEGLELDEIIRVHSETVEKGVVISQRPEPEEWTGEPITLIASAGPHEVIYYCPEFAGMIKDDAMFLARELELDVIIKQTGDDDSVVVRQSPAPGSELRAGSTITLRLGGG